MVRAMETAKAAWAAWAVGTARAVAVVTGQEAEPAGTAALAGAAAVAATPAEVGRACGHLRRHSTRCPSIPCRRMRRAAILSASPGWRLYIFYLSARLGQI